MKNHNTKGLFFLFTSFFLAAMLITSCVKERFNLDEFKETGWKPTVAVPLVYASLTVQHIITQGDKEGQIQVGSDKFCTLVYKGNIFSLPSGKIIQLPDQSQPAYSASLNPVQIASLTSAGTVTAAYTQAVNFSSGLNNPEIDSTVLKTGMFNISLLSDFQYSGQVVITIPSAKKNGVPLSRTIQFTYAGTTPVSASANIDLSGYTFDMTKSGTTFNQFDVRYDVTLSGSGAPPTTSDAITLNQSLSNLQYNIVYGYIGQLFLSPDKDTVEISIFKNKLGTGTYNLIDPSVKVIISNSYGVPIEASMQQLYGYTPPSTVIALNGSPNPLPIYSPNFSQIGQTLVGSFTLNAANSNIVPVINSIPKNIIYQIGSQSNKAGPTHLNFVTDSSRFKVDMELYLPFYGTAKDFALQDTFEFEMDNAIDDEVEFIEFRIYSSNGFPVDMKMQGYFTDSNYVKLDSLVLTNNLLLRSASVNSAGVVTSPTENTYTIEYQGSRIKKLDTARHILIKTEASSTNNGNTPVKIYSDYRLLVGLGVKARFNIKIKP